MDNCTLFANVSVAKCTALQWTMPLRKSFNYLLKDFLVLVLIFWECLKTFSSEEVRKSVVAIIQSTRGEKCLQEQNVAPNHMKFRSMQFIFKVMWGVEV